jgi:release factor glutamine methyltransferase
MRVVNLPGTFRPLSDTWMLARALEEELERRPDDDEPPEVLDLGTGSGALATAAALHGAKATAVDRSRRAVATAQLTALVNGTRIRTRHGDLFDPVGGERFDVIVSNPPYVPAEGDALPERGPRRATDAGTDGRAVLDRICEEAYMHLRPTGALLLVHSDVCGEEATLEALEATGLHAEVAERHPGPLGPLLSERRELLVDRGLMDAGADGEEVLVIRATHRIRP